MYLYILVINHINNNTFIAVSVLSDYYYFLMCNLLKFESVHCKLFCYEHLIYLFINYNNHINKFYYAHLSDYIGNGTL